MDLRINAAALFAPIHKALRLAACELLAELGRFDADDAVETARVMAALHGVLFAFEKHLEHEETFVRPEVAKRLSGGTAFDEHDAHARQIAELRALANAFTVAPAEHRATAKRTLYVHFTTFVGESLVHMAEEERVLAPLLDRVFTLDELLSVQGRIQAAISAEERAYIGPYVMRALDPLEKAFAARMMEKQAGVGGAR